MSRAYFESSIESFLNSDPNLVLGELTEKSEFSVELVQISAWQTQITLLKAALRQIERPGAVYLEYAIPRLGKRIDTILVIGGVVFVIEFKVGAIEFWRSARDQVWDYALDLKNFHQTSHDKVICPVLIATEAPLQRFEVSTSAYDDGVLRPLLIGGGQIREVIEAGLSRGSAEAIRVEEWNAGRYLPTPSIIEAATALYAGHGVSEISRSDAGAENLGLTTAAVDRVIDRCRTGNWSRTTGD